MDLWVVGNELLLLVERAQRHVKIDGRGWLDVELSWFKLIRFSKIFSQVIIILWHFTFHVFLQNGLFFVSFWLKIKRRNLAERKVNALLFFNWAVFEIGGIWKIINDLSRHDLAGIRFLKNGSDEWLLKDPHLWFIFGLWNNWRRSNLFAIGLRAARNLINDGGVISLVDRLLQESHSLNTLTILSPRMAHFIIYT